MTIMVVIDSISKHRAVAGLTWAEIANVLGVSVRQAQRIDAGERWPLDPELVERIRIATNGQVTPEVLHRRRLAWWRARRNQDTAT